MKIRQPKSLKMKLSLYFLFATVVPSILISIFYYYYSTYSLKKNMISNANASEAYIIDNIDNQLKLAIKLSDWMFINKTFEKTLTDYNLINPDKDEKLLSLEDILANTVTNSPITKNISSIIISGYNGVDIRFGDCASLIDKAEVEKNQWFDDSINRGGIIYFPGIIENPSAYKLDDYVIPIVRPIVHSTLGTNIGWSFIALRESLISDVYNELYKQSKNPIYIVDSKGTCISSTDKQYIGKSMADEEFIKPLLNSSESGNFNSKEQGKTGLIVYSSLKLTDWKLVQKISYSPLYEQSGVLLRMTILIFLLSVLVTSIFTIFLSYNFTKPLQKMLKRMRIISKGNFEIDLGLEGDDEMGELGKGINELASNVHNLLEKVKKEEREKRNLELMVLQNQVNPHFLYNTLNSIKWMATVQKADGIRDMVSALGRLLMNISKEKSEEISIRRELSLTEDYIFIQNMRYNGKIKVEYFISDEKLLENQIVKFTLQPIVENAIFHGIEPKKEAGNIKIGITKENGSLIMFVEDDGVGIDEKDINKIFSTEKEHESRGLRSIGVKNVDERLKLFYGNDYGISIKSAVGLYTRVIIKIPKI